RSRSISTACTCGTRASNASVSAASPGPISTSRSSARGATASTIASTTEGSTRKCCPKRLRARCPPRSVLTGGLRRHRVTVELVLDVGAVAQLAQPVLVALLDAPLAQRLARLLAQPVGRALVGAPLDDLDQVHAEGRAHGIAQLPRRERVHRP